MDERDAFLLDFHALHPGVTARVFAPGRLEDGASSYDAMVAHLEDTRGPVLDLGCGDGYLLERIRAREPERELCGVDMSSAELAAARARPSLAGVELVRARADALPLDSARFGAVVSHMAFMLMTPLDAVVDEISRVLAPGGRFVAAVGGGPCADDAFELFLGVLARHKTSIPRLPPRLGDKRARAPEGLRELFHEESGFEPPRVVDHTVRVDGDLDAVWPFLSTFYELGFAPPEVLATMRAEFAELAPSIAGDDGVMPCAMRLTFATATRAT